MPTTASMGTCAAISDARGEPAWLRAVREAAWAAYEAAPMPDRVGHLWRYTAPEQFLADGGAAAGRDREVPPTAPAGLPRRSAAGAEAGVVVMSLHEAAATHADLVRAHLGTLVGPAFGKIEALNAACWEDGIFVYVPRRAEVKLPVQLLREAGAGARVPRLLVIAEEQAVVTVVDEYAGGGLVNAVVEIFAGPASQVRYVPVQRLGPAAVAHLTQRARIDRDARFLFAQASLGAAVFKADVGSVLAGRGAESLLLGVAVGDGRQHCDHHTVHEHAARDTRSDIEFKVVLRDRARSAYTGLIRIAKDALNSEAYQENRNLLLSAGTKAESIPELEILTDEVKCTHGATMGPIDPEHVFYLMCRGVPKDEAVRMIVTGFVEPTLARMPEDLRERMRPLLAQKLGIAAEADAG